MQTIKIVTISCENKKRSAITWWVTIQFVSESCRPPSTAQYTQKTTARQLRV